MTKPMLLRSWSMAVLIVGLVATAGCRARPVPDARPEVMPTPTPRTAATLLRRGIEVSAASGVVDWQRVAIAGLSFAVVRATDGFEVDPAFAVNWQGLSSTSLVRGAAHVFDPEADPEVQARAYLAEVELHSGDLAPVVEVEELGEAAVGNVAERLQVVLDTLEARWGVPPIVLTSAAVWDARLPGSSGRCPLWVVDHKVQEPTLPHGWDRWQLWEFRSVSRFAGIEPPVDLSDGGASTDAEEEDSEGLGSRVTLSRGNGNADDLTRLLIP